jgi:asparagine synthase (glutamine-hydrolysing)
MCGITGYLAHRGLDADRDRQTLERMVDSLGHRGPDDRGVWLDATAGIALGHRRLSILDLSPLGHQPMVSASGRWVVSYNGEIYNFAELRRELTRLGHAFRGGSDTEVFLAAVEAWGVEQALKRSSGMFAIALWDRQSRVLTLARDRLGEKPLYWSSTNEGVFFASELKALRANPRWSAAVNRQALALLLKHNFIPAPHTIHESTWKLAPGGYVQIRSEGGALRVEEHRYWDPRVEVAAALTQPIERAEAAVECVNEAIESAVARQLVADVPVGAFLSGGIDSSLIVAKMQARSSQPIRTFTIGFADERFNEAPFAEGIAKHLGTEHTQLVVTPRDVLNVIPQLPTMYDEPFADSSQLPTFLVAQLARRTVTVSLSGDGGDELFSGYDRYDSALKYWRNLSQTPAWVRAAQARIVESLSDEMLVRLVRAFAPSQRGKGALDSRLRQRARFWRANSIDDVFDELVSYWRPAPVLDDAGKPLRMAGVPVDLPAGIDAVQRMMYTDMVRYLPDDILVKVDRAAMAVSLETRVPLLDPQVVTTAWRIPSTLHRHDGRGKWILRQILSRHVDVALFDRPKRGFAVPIADWLRLELREWADSLLDARCLQQDGLFDVAAIQRRWHEHLRGDMDWSFHLWGVLMFQAWRQAQTAAVRQYDRLPARHSEVGAVMAMRAE